MINFLAQGKVIFNSIVDSTFQEIKNIRSHPIGLATKDAANSFYGKTIKWFRYTSEAISAIPQKMQKNNPLAFGVVFTLNSIFFFTINCCASLLEKTLESKDDGQEVFKRRFVDLSIFAGTAAFNLYGIPLITNYHLSRKTIFVVSSLMVLFRPTKNALDQEKGLQKQNKTLVAEIDALKQEINTLKLENKKE